ncbi:MAG: sigma factor [Polyangiaceae bacterium]
MKKGGAKVIGSRAAEVIAQHRVFIRDTVRHFGVRSADVDDVTQEVFQAVTGSLARLEIRKSDSVGKWLQEICYRQAMNHFRVSWRWTMAIVAGIAICLLVACVVLLIAIFRRVGFVADSFAASLDEMDKAGERQSAEQIQHRDATAAITVAAIREVGGAIVGELKKGARERRRAIEQLERLAPYSARPFCDSVDRPDFEEPASGAVLEGSSVRPGSFLLPPDAPTPRSGYPLWELLGEGEERRP